MRQEVQEMREQIRQLQEALTRRFSKRSSRKSSVPGTTRRTTPTTAQPPTTDMEQLQQRLHACTLAPGVGNLVRQHEAAIAASAHTLPQQQLLQQPQELHTRPGQPQGLQLQSLPPSKRFAQSFALEPERAGSGQEPGHGPPEEGPCAETQTGHIKALRPSQGVNPCLASGTSMLFERGRSGVSSNVCIPPGQESTPDLSAHDLGLQGIFASGNAGEPSLTSPAADAAQLMTQP